MDKRIIVDSSFNEETRVAFINGSEIEHFEVDTSSNKKQLKGNVYLAKVSRVEPSLQAAFVDFGRERHGFLSFNDIQTDYYQLPQSDLEVIKKEEEKVREELIKESEKNEDNILEENANANNQDPIDKSPEEDKLEILESKPIIVPVEFVQTKSKLGEPPVTERFIEAS